MRPGDRGGHTGDGGAHSHGARHVWNPGKVAASGFSRRPGRSLVAGTASLAGAASLGPGAAPMAGVAPGRRGLLVLPGGGGAVDGLAGAGLQAPLVRLGRLLV